MNKNIKAGLITVGVVTLIIMIFAVWPYCIEYYPTASAAALAGVLSLALSYIFQSIKSKL